MSYSSFFLLMADSSGRTDLILYFYLKIILFALLIQNLFLFDSIPLFIYINFLSLIYFGMLENQMILIF
jgi:hypothetical protein